MTDCLVAEPGQSTQLSAGAALSGQVLAGVPPRVLMTEALPRRGPRFQQYRGGYQPLCRATGDRDGPRRGGPRVHRVRADPTRLQQIFMNLVSNANHAIEGPGSSPSRSIVTVSTPTKPPPSTTRCAGPVSASRSRIRVRG
jgi:signal transduction histidine kinase